MKHSTLIALLLPLGGVHAVELLSTDYWDIGTDIQGPERLNGVSYQEDVLITHGNHQYVTFYDTAPAGYLHHYVNVGRRQVSPSLGEWEFLTLTDYVQTTMDGHNMISMGISGDGRIHLSFDHHDVPLNYRVSTGGIAEDVPQEWTADLFGPVIHELPGSEGPWDPLTYPRFQNLDGGDMLLELRIGGSGDGDSYIHRYSVESGDWTPYGMYIQGNDNNAYINGLDTHDGKLYTSWTVRETPDANTNHDLFFAYSEDAGQTWLNSQGEQLTKPILADSPDAMIWEVPQNSAMVNQEGQLVDAQGRFHMLMRGNTSGEQLYEHYLRDTEGQWTVNLINPGDISGPDLYAPRGKLAADRTGNTLVALLPDEPKLETRIYTASASDGFRSWALLTVIPNASTEPLYDQKRLRDDDILSVFVRQGGPYPDRKLQVWDFQLAF
ncbi:uncharacterized protein F5Z01DRAFT_735580 [Emericellopsis atlantica]|uniref:BNR repeat-containing family member n=1 Tax=Emericellopsis atlantica TaxID=2614577 RepID=A0A9P7ZP07_9HYPO|nr:uncharacterized protein F5Z01DRAFT_735580 [Emericellopsis atlantica]KAG9255639.1 hypothetical protein F5Z01DRAFT_735580 [Emericellopsis atlantica]